jgi:hypothetical protein
LFGSGYATNHVVSGTWPFGNIDARRAFVNALRIASTRCFVIFRCVFVHAAGHALQR